MKCLIVLVAVLAVSSAQFFNQGKRGPVRPAPVRAAAPVHAAAPKVNAPRASSSDQSANVLRYDNDVNPDGSYSYALETDNGISLQEQGTPKNLGGNPPETPVVASGSFAFTSPEGVPVAVSYIADENGFQPNGDVLPVAPPVPPQIQRALEWLAKNAPPQKKK
ncbi:larval cuticle protein LCP-22-like [Hyposmocoma kahamanoa]|uniref:larval cuticle protein LCP-22-like n=1 Tax=Hyposmocoma kahamanoa TaxID=1477025 RepID=UPI000E6D9B17|nr:larval cuticle protein LCP-22-like [Hyposmocoma kahamanoa]